MKNSTKCVWIFASIFAITLMVSNQVYSQTTFLTEGWENTTASTNVPPPGWAIDNLGYSNITYFMTQGTWPTVNPYEGSRLVDFESFSYGSGTTNRLRMSTPITTIGYNNISVDFMWYTDNGYPSYTNEGVTVQYSTDGVNWINAGSLWQRYGATNQWVMNTQALPVGAANQTNLYVGFLFLSQYGNDCHMDVIHVKGTNNQTLMLTEGWESAFTGTNTPPAGWTTDVVLGSNITYFQVTGNWPTVTPFEGSRLVDFASFSFSTATNRLRRSVAINAGAYSNINVDYAWYTDNGYPGTSTEGVTIQWSTDGVNWNSAGPVNMRYGITNEWRVYKQLLPAGASGQATLYVGFLFNSNYGDDCHMDIIHVYGTASALPPSMVTQAADNISCTGATLHGTCNANNSTTNVYFDYGLTAAYGTTVNGVPPTVSGSTVTSVSAALTGLAPGTLYHYRVRGVNAGGTTNGSDMTFTSGSAALATTNAATNVGIASATLNGSVNPNNVSTTVTFDWGPTVAYGNSITATQSPVSGGSAVAVSANLTGLNIATTYHYRVRAVSTCGTTLGLDQSFYTCVNPSPAGTITGPTNVCQLGIGYVYSVPIITNAITYVWSVPSGWVITNGGGTATIVVNIGVGAASGPVSVYGSSVCGNGTPSSLNVTVNGLPSPTISGPATSCTGYSNVSYSTQAGNSNYTWNISSGGLITGGQGTNAITVTWNTAGSQNVTVNYTSPLGCSAPNPVVYPVTVNASPTPTIAGTTEMCVNSGYYYYTTESGKSSYSWTISGGGTITFGQGTNQAQVMWNGAGSQWIAVNYSNASGCLAPTPTTFSVMVDDYPGPAGTISGTPVLCSPSSGIEYSCAPISGALTYVWALPLGATIASGTGTNDILVDFGATAASGTITVYGNSLCGDGTLSPPFSVTVNPTPPAPVITATDFILTSDAPDGNQWYKDGAMIAGAVYQMYDASLTGNGEYWDIVTLNGCASGESNHIDITNIGINDIRDNNGVKLYPNPTNGKFTLQLTASTEENYDLAIFNNIGMQVYQVKDLRVKGTVSKLIDLSGLTSGVYSVMLTSGSNNIIKKVVLDK